MYPANSTRPLYAYSSHLGVSTHIGSGGNFSMLMACGVNGAVLKCDTGYCLNQMAVCGERWPC